MATLYTAVLDTEGFTVGQANAKSGLFRLKSDGSWSPLGWPNVRCFGVSSSPGYLYLACGNGVHRSSDMGRTWRITTDWRITEVLDVCIHPKDPSLLMASTAYGPVWSPDRGDTWHQNKVGLTATFAQTVVYDRRQERWMVGTEDGLFACKHPSEPWVRAGLAGSAVRRIGIADDLDAELAFVCATDGGGVHLKYRGSDWNAVDGLPANGCFYSSAVSANGELAAVGGYQSGVYLSYDHGRSWGRIATGLTNLNIQALAFHPSTGVPWAGTTGGGLFELEDDHWVHRGLDGSTIRKFLFEANQ